MDEESFQKKFQVEHIKNWAIFEPTTLFDSLSFSLFLFRLKITK